MKKKILPPEVIEVKPEIKAELPKTKTEKEMLVEVYEFMKSRGINSISNIENLIARS